MTGVDPTAAPELDAIVWRDRDGTYWRFLPPDANGDDVGGFEWTGTWVESWYSQDEADDAWGPLVAVGTLPAWTGPDDDVEPDDVPTVTE